MEDVELRFIEKRNLYGDRVRALKYRKYEFVLTNNAGGGIYRWTEWGDVPFVDASKPEPEMRIGEAMQDTPKGQMQERKTCQNCGGADVYEVYPPLATAPLYRCTWCGHVGPVHVTYTTNSTGITPPWREGSKQ